MLKLDKEQRKFILAIGNASRLGILIALWKAKKELNIYRIHKHTGLGRSAINRHLKVLIEADLISRKIYGEIIFYYLNEENLKVRALIDFFEKTRV